MKESQQKKLTKYFFNKVSKEWWERTYDPAGNFLKFPSNKVRMETALKEIENLRIRGRILDIGCGSGHLVIELLRKRYPALGIDIAKNMIGISKDNLAASGLKADPEKVFKVIDLVQLPKSYKDSKFDAVVALGVLEYLERDAELFQSVNKILKRGGYLLVDCRNRFFNLFSANKYTSELGKRGGLSGLIAKFSENGKFSPFGLEKVPFIQKEVSRNIFEFLKAELNNPKWFSAQPPAYSSYPQKMVRRQHIPEDLEISSKKAGFELKYVVYWHGHLYPPYLEKNFPAFYNKISFLMGPLGYTKLGAWMCSSFIAILKKK